MAQIYPDDYTAQVNAAFRLWESNEFLESLSFAKRAASNENAMGAHAKMVLGHALLGTGQVQQAKIEYAASEKAGVKSANLALARTDMMEGNTRKASARISSVGTPERDAITFDAVTAAMVDRDYTRAFTLADKLSNTAGMGAVRKQASLLVRGVAAYATGDVKEMNSSFQHMINMSKMVPTGFGTEGVHEESAYILIHAAFFSALNGETRMAKQLAGSARLMYPKGDSLLVRDLQAGFSKYLNRDLPPLATFGRAERGAVPFIVRIASAMARRSPGGEDDMGKLRQQQHIMYAELGCG